MHEYYMRAHYVASNPPQVCRQRLFEGTVSPDVPTSLSVLTTADVCADTLVPDVCADTLVPQEADTSAGT